MPAGNEHDITGILRELSQGQPGALDRLIPMVYEELRRIAHRQFEREQAGHTLSTTGLVHEAYLRLVNLRDVDWQHRAHFFAVSAGLMRRILVDYARSRRRDKRGGRAVRVTLDDATDVPGSQGWDVTDLIDLEEALTRLEAMNHRQCRVVECRCVAGLSVEETAVALGTSPATVKRDWAFARAWLNRELGKVAGGEAAAT